VSRPQKPFLIRYGIAVASVGLALAINLLLKNLEQIPSVLFLAAVLISSWYGGLGRG
jgi:hypothetical protein